MTVQDIMKRGAAGGILLALLAAGCVPQDRRAAQQPEIPPLGRVDFPPYESRTLANGLQVFVLEHHEQPVLSLQLAIGAGAAHDPAGLPGVASFTAALLNSGTTTRGAQEISEAIDTVGGQLGAGAEREAIVVTASVLRDSTDLAFDLLADVTRRPAFAAGEIERLRQQSLSGMAADLRNPDFIADAVFLRALYGDHPYGHPANGTPASLARIGRDDLVQFHERHFTPGNAVLSIVGALGADEAFRLAEQWFGDWPAGSAARPDVTGSVSVAGRQIWIIDDPNSVQTEIRIGHAMVARNDPGYFPVLVASYVLGGPQGRLMDVLRSERGLTYGAYSVVNPNRRLGSIYATTETRTDMTVEAVNLILEEIERLRSEPSAPGKVEDAKAYIIGTFPLTIETPADLARRLTNLFIYELGDDYLDTYRDRIAAIRAEDIQATAQEAIHGGDVVIVLLGQADAFRREMEALGEVRVIPLSGVDLDSPSLGAAE